MKKSDTPLVKETVTMKAKAADFLLYDQASGTYRVDPEQAVRDDVEKHHWLHV